MDSNHTPSVRQPVSCEPCRRRKIKCSKTRPPCDTCRRRGFADLCVYKGPQGSSSQSSSSPGNEELFSRIEKLEALLRTQMGAEQSGRHRPMENASSNRLSSPMLSPPVEQISNFGPSPESFMSENPNSTPSIFTQNRDVGVLTSSPTGNVRYEPRSSQWTAVLANSNLSIAMPALHDDVNETIESGFPFTSSPVPSLDDLLILLPPMQQCDYLKDKYFAVFSPLFHILHDPTFHNQYTQFIEDYHSVSISWLAVLFTLLSLAVTALEESDPVIRDLARGLDAGSNIRLLSKRYREAAMKCLSKQGVFWGKHNLQSLQALIMLTYAMGHSQEPTWILLGMTYNVAIALACHIDPSKFDLDPIQSEERRRCWAGLMMLYTIQNTILGNPDPSLHISYDVQLPADTNDVDITLTGVEQNHTGPTQMSYLLFKFKLYDLTAKICTEIFSTKEPSQDTIQQLDSQICLEQETWDNRYLVDSTFHSLPVHHAVHLHILHAYSHQLFLLLHRPFFAQSILGFDVPNESKIRCIASAEALLDIHRILSETPTFRPYMWYTNGIGSFHAFHAAAVLAAASLMPIYKPQYQKFRRVLDETLVRFEGSAGRSKICEKSSRILRFLLAVPSPNQSSSINFLLAVAEDKTPSRDGWVEGDWMKVFAERLQPQQWLGPANIAWTEWDNMMAPMDGIRA